MSAEKEVIVAAVEAMLKGVQGVLNEAGIEIPKETGKEDQLKAFDGITVNGKVRHSDSQRALKDPEAMKAYQENAAKALWNFALTLKKILSADGLLNMAKLGLDQKSFLGENIDYLDCQHLDENGNNTLKRNQSFAILIVDPQTQALANQYRQFLNVVVENKEAIFKMLPWVVRGLVGSVLESAVAEAAKIKETLTRREREFEKNFMTRLQLSYSILNETQPFFILLDTLEQEISRIINDKNIVPEKKIELIRKLKEDLNNNTTDKDTIQSGITKLEEYKAELRSKDLSEVGIDINALVIKIDAAIQTLQGFLANYDDAVAKRESMVKLLQESEEKLIASQKEGKRNTPMDERPAALMARVDELILLEQDYKDSLDRFNQIQDEITAIKLRDMIKSTPLINIQGLDEKKKISSRLDSTKFKQIVQLLGIDTKKAQDLEIVCDRFVFFEEAEKKRVKAWDELSRLVTEKMSRAPGSDVTIEKLEAEAKSLNIDLGKHEEKSKEMEVLFKKITETTQREIGDYQAKIQPLLESLEKLIENFKIDFKKKSVSSHLKEMDKTLDAIEKLNDEYADCLPINKAPQEYKKMKDLSNEVMSAHRDFDNNIELMKRKDLYTLYFGKGGFAISYLEKSDKDNQASGKSKSKTAFFGNSKEKVDVDKQRDLIVKIGNKFTNYVESGDQKYLHEALMDIDSELSRKSPAEPMKALLKALKHDIEKRITPAQAPGLGSDNH